MKFGLSEKTIEEIYRILMKYPQVKQAIIYGSRARGDYKNGSDIDITLIGTQELTRNVLYRIMDDLDDSYLPYTFDVSILNEIQDEEFLNRIKNEGIVFYNREGEDLSHSEV